MAARVAPPTPPLICKFSSGGTGPLGAASYDAEKPGSLLLWTNLEGSTPRAWARQIGAFRDLNKRLRRVIDHVSLSLDPRLGKLTPEQWLVAAKVWLHDMGYGNRAVIIHHHGDEPQDHIHLVICRLDAHGRAHSDSQIFRRGHAAATAAAELLGLVPLPAREDAATKLAPGDSAIAAVRRAKRRGTPTSQSGSVAKAFDSLVSRCVSLDDLEARACGAGLELQVVRKSGGEIQGLNARAIGVQEWTKASTLNRDRSLSWSKVQARLAENAVRRARAQASADAANNAARERAAQRVAERLAAQQHIVPLPARALLPAAANLAKEAIMQNDKLDFLEPPRPPATRLDDAVLAAPFLVPVSVPEPAAGGLTALELRDRDEAELEFLRQLRAKSVSQLLDLRRLDVPPLVLTAAAIEQMLNLVLKLLSFGLVRRADGLADALAARQRLQKLAEDELSRRRRTPHSQAAKRKALNDHVAALTKREVGLVERAANRTMPDAHAAERAAANRAKLFKENEAGFDRLQVSRELPTIATRRAALVAATAAEKLLGDEVPVAMGLLMMPKAKAAAMVSRADHAVRLRAAAARRTAAAAALQLCLDQVEDAVAARIAEDAAEAAAVAAREVEEKKLIEQELKDLGPEILAAGNAADRERVGQAAKGFLEEAEAPRAEAADLEAEREALRRALGKGA